MLWCPKWEEKQPDEEANAVFPKSQEAEKFKGRQGARERKRLVIAAGAAAAVVWFVLVFLRTGQIVWTSDFIAYSGYCAGEHVKEFTMLPDAAMLFTDVSENTDGSVSLTVNSLQRIYYRCRYKKMLSQAEEDCRALGVDVKVSEDCRNIYYYSERFQDFFNASLACARAETFASCLQMEKNTKNRNPWCIRITICRKEDPHPQVAAFTIPEEEVNVIPQMWEDADPE